MNAVAVVAEPRRQEILRLVWRRQRSAGEIHHALSEVTFGAVSQHLRILRDAGLVDQEKRGRHRLYRARRDAFGPLAAVLEAMWAEKLSDLKRLAEEEESRG